MPERNKYNFGVGGDIEMRINKLEVISSLNLARVAVIDSLEIKLFLFKIVELIGVSGWQLNLNRG